jgi:accessory gene regulator B
MIDKLALSIATGIKNTVPDHPASIARLKYSLSFILNAVFIIVFSLLVSLLTGKTYEVAILLFSFAILRQVSGGIHLKSGTTCVVVTVAVANAFSFLEISNDVTLWFTGISILIALIFAPSGIEKQTRIPQRFYPLLKIISVIIISSNFIIESDMAATAFLIQAISLMIKRKEVKSR